MLFVLGWQVWSVPEALITAELATAFPENGGYVVWVTAAFGEFWGFQVCYRTRASFKYFALNAQLEHVTSYTFRTLRKIAGHCLPGDGSWQIHAAQGSKAHEFQSTAQSTWEDRATFITGLTR